MLQFIKVAILQSILSSFTLLIWVVFIPWLSVSARLCFPLLVSPLFCFILNRKKIVFKHQNTKRRRSMYKFFSRIISILLILIIGCIVYASHTTLYVDINGYGDAIATVIGNFNFYVYTSLVLFIFALIEYIFVAN